MKKIAIITNHNHMNIGGIEKYNRTLYEAFSGTVNFTEYPIYKTNVNDEVWNLMTDITVDNSLNISNGENFLSKNTYSFKKMKSIFEDNDLVIMSLHNHPKKWLKHPKTVVVQHMDAKYYTMLGKRVESYLFVLGFFFGSILFNIGTLFNSLKKAHHTVFFSKETSVKTKNIHSYIPLFDLKYKEITNTSKYDGQFTWMGRLAKQKDPVFASNISNIFSNFYIYGEGPLKEKMLEKLKDKDKYKNSIKDIDSKVELFGNTKCMIITSKIEGFPFVIVEALSRGIPVIVLNTFKSVKFFEKSGAVFPVDKKNVNAFKEKMDYINDLSMDDYNELSKKAINFSKKNLTYELFVNNWKKIIG